MSGFFGGGGGSGSATPTTVFQPWGGSMGGALSVLSGANKIQMSGFYLPNSLTFGNIVVDVISADPGVNYDWGIFDVNGTLKAHVGAHSVAAGGIIDLAISGGGTVTLAAGKYYFAMTGAGATATLAHAGTAGAIAFISFLLNTESVTASALGVLPGAVTPPADSWNQGVNVHAFALH